MTSAPCPSHTDKMAEEVRFAYGLEEHRDFISPSEVVKCSSFILLVLLFYFGAQAASGGVYKDCFSKLFKKF